MDVFLWGKGDASPRLNAQGWTECAINAQSEDRCDLKCEVIPVTSVPGEPQQLGVMIRDFRPFQGKRMCELVRMKMTSGR